MLVLALGVGTKAQAVITDITYDFSTTTDAAGVDHCVAGVDCFAWRPGTNAIPSSPIPPTANNIPATLLFSASDYTAVAASDIFSVATSLVGGSKRAAMRFVFTIYEDPATLTSLGVFWEGQVTDAPGAVNGTIQVYLWNASTSSYTLVGSTTSTEDVTLSLSDTINPAQYVDASPNCVSTLSNCVTILVVNTGDNAGIQTDYVKLTVRQCSVNSDCDDDIPCQSGACSAEGLCSYSNNTAACSDGNPCTVGDVCSGGSCQSGSPPNCLAFDDQCNTASCDPVGLAGNCDTLTPVADDTTECNDQLFCTVSDLCTGGVCDGIVRDCSASGDQCNTGVCDENAGACVAQPVADGTACDDGLFCTVEDSCSGGACDGSPRDCSASGDQCNTGVCDENAGACVAQPVAGGTVCDDGDACNVGETCQAGVCAGGTAPNCSAAGDQCNTASCDPLGPDGNCDTLTPVADGTSCDDGDACNVDEACQGGVCAGGTAPDCSSAGDQCNTASCDPTGAEGNCDTLTPVADGTSCDDGDACNVGETCQTGVCAGGNDNDCSSAGDQCKTATCDPAGAEGNCDTLTPLADGSSCNDGLFCNGVDTCSGGSCSQHAGNPCPGPDGDSNCAESCNEAGDACNASDPSGSSCNDGNSCTSSDGTASAGDACNGAGVCNGTRMMATVSVLKLTDGVVNPNQTWTFALYSGSHQSASSSFLSNALVTDETLADPDGVLDFGDYHLDPNAAYALCERNVPAGWSSMWQVDTDGDGVADTTAIPYNPNETDVPAQDIGNRCLDVGAGTPYPLPCGDSLAFEVDNRHPGGNPRSPGYWKNWNRCTGGGQQRNADRNGGWTQGFWLLEDVLDPNIGGGIVWDDILSDALLFTIRTCSVAVRVLDQRDVQTGTKRSSDAAYTLAMHLLAAQMNFAAGACVPLDPVADITGDGVPETVHQIALAAERLLDTLNFKGTGGYLTKSSANRTKALQLASLLERYSRGGFCGDFH